MSRRRTNSSTPILPRPEETLSFFRHATVADRAAGAMPLVFWSVEPSGDYLADVERGKAIADELLAFVAAAPTEGNMTLLSSVLVDMQRFGSMSHRGLLIGFGRVLMNSAIIGAVVAGIHGFNEIKSPLSEPAADPFVERMHRFLNEVRAFNANPDAVDEGAPDPFDPFGSDLRSGALRISSAAGAAMALRQVIWNGAVGCTESQLLIEKTLEFLEGRAA